MPYLPPTNAQERVNYARNLAAGGANVQNYGPFNNGFSTTTYGPHGYNTFLNPESYNRPATGGNDHNQAWEANSQRGLPQGGTGSLAGDSASTLPPGAMQAAAPRGPLAPDSLSPGTAPVQSTIDGYSPIYSQQQTTAHANQQASKARQLGSPRMAMKKFGRPGMSHDEGTLAAALPQITAARAQANNLLGTLPLQDAFANENFMLSGQEAAGRETSSLADLLLQMQQVQDNERQSAISAMLNPALGSIFG